jgi:hypothetical protein
MAKKRHGYWCWSCQRYRSNESFSGKGHAKHLCKDCQREQKRQRRLKRLGIVEEPESAQPSEVFNGMDLDEELFEPVDPDAFYWEFIRPMEDDSQPKRKRKK